MTEKCYSQHQKQTNQQSEEDVSLLLKMGGKFNEILEVDDIDEFDD